MPTPYPIKIQAGDVKGAVTLTGEVTFTDPALNPTNPTVTATGSTDATAITALAVTHDGTATGVSGSGETGGNGAGIGVHGVANTAGAGDAFGVDAVASTGGAAEAIGVRSEAVAGGVSGDAIGFAINNVVSANGTAYAFDAAGLPLKALGPLLCTPAAAPADALLQASQFTFWLDPTNGAAKLHVKAKSANGTVVGATINLT